MPLKIRQQGYQPSGVISASAAVKGAAGVVGGVLVINDGANDPTIKIFDNANAGSGTEIFRYLEDVSVSFGAGGPAQKQHIFLLPDIQCVNGIYITLSGTGAAAVVYYK